MKTLKYSEVGIVSKFNTVHKMEIDRNKLSFSIETRWINETDSYISKKKTALVDKPRNNKRKRRKKITWKSSGLRFALSRE